MPEETQVRQLMLLAPPGAGKGTQGTRLGAHFGIAHLSVGDLLRDLISRGTEVGRRAGGYLDRGELVPDDVVLDAVLPRVLAAADDGGYVLDGFPRSVAQADAAAGLVRRPGLGLEAVIYLDVPEEELIARLIQRGRDAGRADDTPEVIRNRLRLFTEQTAPLVARYHDRGILVSVDGDQAPDDVTAAIHRALDALPASAGPRA